MLWRKKLWVGDPLDGTLNFYKGKLLDGKKPEVILIGRRLGLGAGDKVEVTIKKV